MQKRKKYLYILFLALALSTISLVVASTKMQWYITVGIFLILYNTSFPIRLAVSMDVKTVDMGFWRVRELFLNIGRVIVQGVAALFFYWDIPWAVFCMFAIISFIYPFLIEKKLNVE